MPFVSIVLSLVSLLTLVLGFFAWRATSSRPLFINILIATAFTLIGGYAAAGKERPEFAFMMPFFAAMLCGGRAVGFLWRSKNEKTLLQPGFLLAVIALACGAGSAIAYKSLH